MEIPLKMMRRTKAPKGAGELVLYLDFDGVLHHADAPHILFQHTPLLEMLLAPYPNIKIILSTSWVRVYGCTKAANQLSPSLHARVIGATFHSAMDEHQFAQAPRGMQVWGDVLRRHPKDWIALDDDDLGWPKWCRDKYVKTNAHDGISDPLVFAEIARKLADMDLRGKEGW